MNARFQIAKFGSVLRSVILMGVFAMGALALGAPASWTVADAPYRIGVKFAVAPSQAEAGFEINIPEFGQTRPDLADVVLTNSSGEPQPLAKIGRRPGGRVVLLAQKLDPAVEYFLYFGGDKLRASPEWTPKTSLLMETRPAPPNLDFSSLQSLKLAWAQSQEPPGAGFFSAIYQGGNPFGPNLNFLTHYSGYLRLPKAREITFYTLSSDCSFVAINDQEQFGWPGRHSPSTTPKSLAKKTVQCPEGLVKIDYYAAKGEIPPEERLEAATVLGWQTDTGFEAIPREAWLHPGATQNGSIQSAPDGKPTPRIKGNVETFAAYAGQWYYEFRFEVGPPPTVANSTVSWEFEDGASVTGTSGMRLLTGTNSQIVKCSIARDGATLTELCRIDIPDKLQRASINDPNDVRRYLGMIDAEAALKLKPEALRPRLLLLCEFGTDQEVANVAKNWTQENPADGIWLAGRLAAIRTQAQTDPAQAKQEFMNLLQFMDPAAQKLLATEITMMEMDLLAFYLRDTEAFGRFTQIAFINTGNDLSRIAKIRIGDLHRLMGHFKEAAEQYRSLTPKNKDQALAAKDTAASIAIRDLLEKGCPKDAQARLLEWEMRRPMTKFDSDYLLLRARTLMAFGRWSEAQTELESFQKVQLDSPLQIDAQFHLARVLYEKGSKDEARKLWNTLASSYPKHPLAPQAKEWANKP